MFRNFAFLSLTAMVVACSQNSTNDPSKITSEGVAVALQPLSSCTELESLIRAKSKAAMNLALDESAQSLLNAEAGECWVYEDAAASGTSSGVSSSGSTPSSVSQTNNQVVGVDEADIIKTDGKFLYLAQGSEFRIVSAWPATTAGIASKVALGGTAKKLFVEGNRALVYVSIPRATVSEQAPWMATSSSDCTYGYGCDFGGDGTATEIVIFDISDRTAPVVKRTIDLPGSLIAARRIGTTVHTVASIGELTVPDLEYYSTSYCGTAPTGVALTVELAKIEQMRARNIMKIDAAVFDVGTLAKESGSVIGKIDCSDFYRETLPDGVGITSVLSLDLSKDSAPTLANVLSRAGAVYASATSLYMSVPHQKSSVYGWYDDVATDEASTVHRFQIGEKPEETKYSASGVVPGHVLNQFAMDEYDGHLRIATSKGYVPDPNVESVMTVLKQTGTALTTIGQLGGIAPTEDIRSVRFQGERGYVVTFKKTDPLFVLDLADPKAPKITGELKIPGFSTYMHPLDSGHLLALGYEADDQGDFAYFNGIQLQIFDVKDLSNPLLLHKKVYGTRGSSSSALTDHLGFTYIPDRNLLTLPMSICDDGGNGQYGTLSFSGVVAMNVSLAKGITELGRLEEPYPEDYTQFQYGGACADWWTDSNSVVSRTVVVDNFLYAVSDNRVRVQDLGSLGSDVKVIDF